MELTFSTQSTSNLSARCALAEEILLNGKHGGYLWFNFQDRKWSHNVYDGTEAPSKFNTRAGALYDASARLTRKFENSVLMAA